MKFPNGGGIDEILSTGQFPNRHDFRVPQPWSVWKSGKATARNGGPPPINRGILTNHGKDDERVQRHLPSTVKKTYRF